MKSELHRLINIIARLRAPAGCPWDREQTHASLLPCLLDEMYEFFEAVDENSPYKMEEELGDLLLQVVLHSQIAKEEGTFTIEDVAHGISEKIIRRHPHVFGDVEVSSSRDVLNNWEQIKKAEKGKAHRRFLVDDIPEALPALFRAEKIQRRVARVGFDWHDAGPALDKVEEEFNEFRQALASGDTTHAVEELGDILFALVNVARHKGICAEEALRAANNKFTRRFRFVEDACTKAGIDIQKASLETLDRFWEQSKKEVG
ncbi:MAG: nucleoside triphosphate pyrophosphohydrolase [Chitinispirillaceae bacterium]|nr:nucleoside triphosphate pyrophosphohydrolase [Chitinispirillaceae bacterium]